MNWQMLQTMSLESIVDWAESQPWAVAMAQCEQDPQWHAEGDVWAHTKLVCKQLQLLDDLCQRMLGFELVSSTTSFVNCVGSWQSRSLACE